MSKIKVVNAYKMLACTAETELFYHAGKILFAKKGDKKPQFLANVPLSGIRKLLVKFRLTERILRLEPRMAHAVGNKEFIVSCGGKVFLADLDNKKFTEEFQYRKGMNNPLKFVDAVRPDGTKTVLYGEYFANSNREEVCVYERRSNGWAKVYAFPEKTVKHIHAIVPDKDCIYILTGDDDKASGIWRTDDYFKNVVPVAVGSQQYRSCVAFPCDGGLLYATDTPREKNYIYLIKPQNGDWKTEIVGEMPGPCIYGCVRNGGYYFATSVEPDDMMNKWRYKVSYKLGPGVKDRYTHVIKYSPENGVREVAALKKDILPMTIFQFGNCQFPDAEIDAPVIVTPVAVKRYDGKTVIID